MKCFRFIAGGALLLASVPVFAEGSSGPTLGDVLKNSGINVSGYIDASAIYNTQGPYNTFRVYDQQGRSINLQMLELSLSRAPDEGFGGAVVLNGGPDATVNESVPECDGAGNCPAAIFPAGFDVQQAYVSYKNGNVTTEFGKLPTLIGLEVIESPANYNFSRSYLFGWGPFIQTGARIAWQATPTIKAVFGVNNGWDQLPTNLTPKTVEAQLAWSPTDSFFISLEGDSGMQDGGYGGTTSIGLRQILDLVSTYSVTKSLTLGLNAVAGYQGNALRPDGSGGSITDSAHWNGQALYANYMVSDKWRVAGRVQRFDDASGFRAAQVGFPCGLSFDCQAISNGNFQDPAKEVLKSATLTLAYMPTGSVELRGELRHDMSDKSVFVKTNGGTAKTQNTISFEGIYKF